MALGHPVTRRLDLTRPVRCAKCGEPFTRTHGRQKLCPGCQPGWVRTQSALRAAARAARQRPRDVQDGGPFVCARPPYRPVPERPQVPVLEAVLGSLCPHGVKLGDCDDIWCRSRREDFERQEAL